MQVEIKVIIPPKFDYRAMQKVITARTKDIIHDMQKDFEKTTSTWKSQPTFEGARTASRTETEGRRFSIYVGPKIAQSPQYEIFGYVDQGTRPHKISPKKPGGVLAFMWGGPGSYKAKSRPGKLRSYAGGIKGGALTFRRWVQHPGTKARDFTKVIQRKWQRTVQQQFNVAMAAAASASGHRYSRN